MWLLGIYAILVTVSEALAVGVLFLSERFMPAYSDIAFVTAIFAALILPWFAAVKLTESWDQ